LARLIFIEEQTCWSRRIGTRFNWRTAVGARVSCPPEVVFAYEFPRPPRLVHRYPVLCRLRPCGHVHAAPRGAQSSADESQLRDSLKTFTDVYSKVEQNYAEPIDGDKATCHL